MPNNPSNKVFGILDVALVKVLVLPIMVTLIMFISVTLLFTPWITSIRGEMTRITDYKKKNNKLSEKISYLKSIDPKVLEDNSKKFNDAIFAEKNSYFLINVIRSVGDDIGFSIANFSLSPGEVKDETVTTKTKKVSVKRIPVEVSLIGPRDKFIEFIDKLEKTLPILAIEELKTKTELNMIKLDLTVSAFFVPINSESKIENLELSDLTLTEEEKILIDRLGEFKKAESPNNTLNISTDSAEYKTYERVNPFGL